MAQSTVRSRNRGGLSFPRTGSCRSTLLIFAVLCALTACGQSAIRPVALTNATKLHQPARILLVDFVIRDTDVNEYQGILRQQPANPNALERQRELAKLAVDTLSAELAKRLRQLGFTVDRVEGGTVVEDHDLLIDGEFENVDEGNPLRRVIIGFGSGAARLETRARVYQGSARRKIVEFIVSADSGKFPGAVATTPAVAIAPASVAVGIGVTGGRVVTTGSTSVAGMATANAEQAARYLSEFFAKQGWIAASQVKKARIGY